MIDRPLLASRSIGIVGARGHVGAELIRLIGRHPQLELGFVSSRELAGQAVADSHPDADVDPDLRYELLDPAAVAGRRLDAVVLALPNGMAAPYVAALDAASPQTLVVDLSADYRFDTGWYYGLPELTRARYAGQRRISNPGCYATAMQLAIAPMRDLLDGPVQCFGVSGYSGAGTTPGPRNDPALLRDNLMPYSLVGHLHEREVSAQLGHAIEFMPHVAPHFRGLTVTANLHLSAAQTLPQIVERYRAQYRGEALVAISEDAPWVSRIAGEPGASVGGFTLGSDGRRLVVVSVLDNLLKGAATQALQNINLAFGWPELEAIGSPIHL